ncbi:MAG TPA: PQQ-dependent sugar dehydrogenase [Solirubrobacterales bacterium]|nr:PQQ-dependent sugar dehydrogenase [Solirubrobacterales bacterium]
MRIEHRLAVGGRFVRVASAALLACGVSLVLTATGVAEPALPPGFQDTVAFEDLEQPTAFRFAPDGRVFVAEKSGQIEIYDDLEDTEPTLFADLRTYVYDHGDRGLLGLALDPEFAAGRPYVYALYTYDHILGDPSPPPKWGTPDTSGDSCPDTKGADDCVVSGRLVRLTADGDQAEEAAGEAVQDVLAEDWCQQFSSHSIGDLQFGPEGALYASGGDGASFSGSDYGQFGTPANPCGDPPGGFGTALTPPSAEGGSLRSQNLHNLSGKIIRIDPDSGEAWPDNPMASSPDADTRRIVAYGFRNPFRFAIDAVTGEIYSGNVGSSEIEEIDRFAAPPKATYNSGWPCYEGPERQFLFKNLGLNVCEDLYDAEPGSTSEPFFYFSHAQEVVPGDECSFAAGSALGGIGFYEGSKFPAAYQGALFFADAVRGCIYVMYEGKDGRPDPLTTTRFLREGQVYPGVDVQEGPDGALYYASLFGDESFGNGAIHRITYAPGAPTARLDADPQWGPVPLEAHLDASESSDPDGDPLQFSWDLDGNGTFETSGGETKTLNLASAVNRQVAVRVSDGDLSSVARITLYPGDEPPQVTIDAPQEDLLWRVGDEISFSGTALDYEGHHLPGLSYYWSARIAHCPLGPESCHKHPLQVFAGVKEGSFVAPEHDYPSYIELTAGVADDRGLTASETVRIDPHTVDFGIASDPAGIPLTAGLKAAPAPFSLTAIEGSNVVLSAPQTAQLGGATYTWTGWSDGGSRAHTVVAEESADFVASYRREETSVDGPPSPDWSLPPEPRIGAKLGSHPPKRTHSTTARFTFEGAGRGARYRCKLDGGSFKPCSSPRIYKGLRAGKHTFRVAPLAASSAAPVKYSWRVLPRPR